MNDLDLKNNVLSLNRKNDIIMQKCAVSGSMDLHTHRFIEIAYVAAGKGVHEIGDGFSSLTKAGDIVLINPGVPHAFGAGDGQLVVYNCIFDPSVLRFAINKSDDFINIVYSCLFGSARQSPVSKPYIVLTGAKSVFPIISEMYAEYSGKPSGYEKVNAANLIRLLTAIFRLQMNERETGVGAYKNAIVQSAVKYMNEYYAEKITCGILAARAYVSTGYFHRVFRSVTGATPNGYLQRLRLEKAAALLSRSGLTVKQAVAAVGYSDMKHFYRIFEDGYGATPKKYQEKNRR